MKEQEIKTLVLQVLPTLIAQDPYVRESVWHIVTPYFAPRQETESRFDQMMAELQRMREDFERKWEQSERKWEEQSQESERRWNEQRLESERRWEEQRRKDEEQRLESERRWDEQRRKDEEQRLESERRWNQNQAELRQMREDFARKWQEQQELNRQMLAEIARVDKKIEMKMGALGARWGIDSETAFRNALRGILEEVAHVQVIHVNEFDDEGVVFGHPDQVELDVVIHNGLLMLCEMKSSVSKGDVSLFERKAHFYAKRHQQTVTHKVIISPMVDPRALPLAQAYGMLVYYNAEDVVLDNVDSAQ